MRLLVGHSLGGAAVLAAAPRPARACEAVATIGAPSEPAHVRRLFTPIEPELEEHGEARIELAGRPFTIRKQFLEDLDEQRTSERLARMQAALLILHSPLDDVVSIEHARKLYQAARGAKSFVTLEDADHLLTRREDSLYVADVLAAWSSRYLSQAAEPASVGSTSPSVAAAGPGGPDAGEVHVTSTAEPFLQEVRVGRHAFFADEPESIGGADRGPGPYDFLLAALGTCTAMTLAMYARHKGLPLEGVGVRLRHDRVHTKDCADCATSPDVAPRVDRLLREIELRGPLDDAQRARMLEIADRCPVHRTLEGPLEIPTRLAGT